MTLLKKGTIKLASIVLAVAMIVTLIQIFAPMEKASAATTGTWVMTKTEYYAYKDGKEQYVSSFNEYYKHRCYFRGVTDDNFVKFQVSGGFYHPSNSKENSYCDAYHLCSVPKSSYAAGGLVTMQVRNYEENIINNGRGGFSMLRIVYENKEADGIKTDPFFHGNEIKRFFAVNQNEYTKYVDMGQSDTLKVNMPTDAKNGDRIAIVFEGSSAYDYYSSQKNDNYGGTVWYAWIYTFQENAPAKLSSVKPSTTSYTYNGKVKTPTVIVKDSKGKTLKENTDYTVSYAKGRKNVGKYAVKITFKGKYSGTKTLYFTIKPKGTRISKVTTGSKKFTVKWKKQATQTTGYQIQYSTSSKFSKAKTVKVGKNSTTSKTISKLTAKKKYYVRVRTYKTVKINGKATKIYSSWSKTKYVTTKK